MNFVIDLNAIRTAWTGETPHRVADLDSGILFAQIIQICSRIVVTDEIDSRYLKLFDELKSGSRQSPRAFNVINLYTTAKQGNKIDATRISSELPHLPDESGIKDEDREFVRLASISRSTLVTYDGPLREVLQKIGVQTASPGEALQRLLRPS